MLFSFNLKVYLDSLEPREVLALKADLVIKGRLGTRGPKVAQVQHYSNLYLIERLV